MGDIRRGFINYTVLKTLKTYSDVLNTRVINVSLLQKIGGNFKVLNKDS